VQRGCRNLIGAFAALAATIVIAAAQTPNLVPGYFDPKTGVFTPAPLPQPPASEAPADSGQAAAVQPPTQRHPPEGTVFIQVNATIQSPIPQSATLNATATISLSVVGSSGSSGDGYQFTLNWQSSNTAKGSVTLPYAVPAHQPGLPNDRPLDTDMQVQLTLSVTSNSGPRPDIQLTQRVRVPQDGGNFTVTFPVTM
jgi:hypothetical protein